MSHEMDRSNCTAMTRAWTDGAGHDLVDHLATTTLLGRGAQADEVAGVIAFHFSPADWYLTGALVPVAGGRRRLHPGLGTATAARRRR